MTFTPRRYAAAALVACVAVALLVPTAAAAKSFTSPSLHGLAVGALHLRENGLLAQQVRRFEATHAGSPRVTSRMALRANDVSDPTTLKIAFPAGAVNVQMGTISAAASDDSSKNLSQPFHDPAKGYVASGDQGGYMESGSIPLDLTGTAAAAQYLGSLFPTDAQATTFVSDAVTYLKGIGLTPDTTVCGTTCYFFALVLPANGQNYELAYTIFSQGNVVAEVAMLADASIQTNSTQLASFANAFGILIDNAQKLLGYSSGTPTPTVNVASFGLVHKVKGKTKTTKSLNYHESGDFVVLVATDDTTDSLTATITFTKGGAQIGSSPMNDLGQAANGDEGFDFGFKSVSKKTVHITAVVTATQAGVEAQSSPLKITLKAKPKK
jgi:hypothetical protein